jgi:toxin ParE1/3/4
VAYSLSFEAEEDVISIYLEGERLFGAQQANRYHRGLEEALGVSGAFPAAAPERPEIATSVRVHPYKAHRIIYRIEEGDVYVLRIRHSREDWDVSSAG